MLVAEDNAGGIFLELAETDEAAAHPALVGARDRELLRIGVERVAAARV